MGRGLLIVRADAGPTFGAGHVMRGLALAQWWQRGGGEALVLAETIPHALVVRCRRSGVEVVQLEGAGPAGLAREVFERRPAWVSLDGYRFGAEEQEAARGPGTRLLVIDDHGHAMRYGADLVLDQNLGARPEPYLHRAPFAVSLLGSRYALLRTEFRDVSRSPLAARRVLVTLGGVASENTDALRDAIAARVADDVDVVVADGAVVDMAALLATCTVALSAAGSTAWELCALAVPMVLVSVAENQLPGAAELARCGAAIDAGPLSALDPDDAAGLIADLLDDSRRREDMASSAGAIVDGLGGERVVRAMDSCGVVLREAVAGDARFTWQLANDEAVRSMSYAPEPIPWEAHLAWFEQRLDASDRSTFIAELDGIPVGQVRFDVVAGRTAEIGVSVVAGHRGRHLAAVLLAHGSGRALALDTVDTVLGLVRDDNEQSVRACQAAGFLARGERARDGVTFVQMTRRRGDVLGLA